MTVHDVVQQVAENNANFGGGFIEHNEEQYTIRGLGRAGRLPIWAAFRSLPQNGVAVLLRDVAQIRELPYPRQGAVMHDGLGETVSGMVIITKGTNSRKLIRQVKAQSGVDETASSASRSRHSTTRAK